MARKHIIIIALAALLIACLCAAQGASGVYPDIILAWDGTGDFGPQTPGTKTCGWQEAIDASLPDPNVQWGQGRDIYVKGGGVYNISQTIHVRPLQDYAIVGGDYTMNWTGPLNQDMLTFDSVMDLRLNLGNMVYSGNGAALRIKPVNPVPIDGFPAWGDAQIKIQSMVRPSSAPAGGTGLVFECSPTGQIGNVDVFVGAIKNFAVGVQTIAAGLPEVIHIRVQCPEVSSNRNNSTLLLVDNNSWKNIFEVGMAVTGGATGVKGVDMLGQNNLVEATVKTGFPSGSAVVFEPTSFGNRLNLVASPDLADPSVLLSDTASNPTNLVTFTGAQMPVRTVSVTPGGTYTYVQRLCPATVRVVGGVVSNIKLDRRGIQLGYGTSREDFVLSVGDKLMVTSSSAPVLQVIPIKTR